MDIPLFSIIIPCYNTAPYLEKCLESVIGQAYQNWEMILVNDGSSDNTINILNEYARKDKRIKVIDQKNQGVSAARNRAINEARGEYLLFLDSDDWYAEDALRKISDSLENGNNDIVVFRHKEVRDDGTCIEEMASYFKGMNGLVWTGDEYLMTVLSLNTIYQWFPFLYAFRRELWTENNIQFNSDLFILEDMDIIYQVILNAKRIRILDSLIYSYRIRKNSACHACSVETMRQELTVCKNCIERVKTLDITESLKRLLMSNFAYTYFGVLTEAGRLEKSDRQIIIRLLQKNRELMNYTIRHKNVFIRSATHVLGVPLMARLLYIRYNWRKNRTLY